MIFSPPDWTKSSWSWNICTTRYLAVLGNNTRKTTRHGINRVSSCYLYSNMPPRTPGQKGDYINNKKSSTGKQIARILLPFTQQTLGCFFFLLMKKKLPKQSVLFFPIYILTADDYNLLSQLPGWHHWSAQCPQCLSLLRVQGHLWHFKCTKKNNQYRKRTN